MSEEEERGKTTEESSGEDSQSPTESTSVSTPSTQRTADMSEQKFNIPIIGFEVMEERAKFTVYKLKVSPVESEECWFVFRRYTDFVRLHTKLKTDYPQISLPLPKKKWFGDNFNNNFLNERIDGLQVLVNEILKHRELVCEQNVRDFFCLDEPPSVDENVEESKAVLETLEERVYQLQRQLKEMETAYERLKSAHSVEISSKLRLAGFVQECTRQCPSCASRLAEYSPSSTSNS